jgi:predicted O-methyltransferase YrrM
MLFDVLRDLLGRRRSAPAQSFLPTFDRDFAPLLAQRAEGFRAVFARVESLARHHGGDAIHPLVVETGSVRVRDNWAGDGQSTRLFDAYVRHHHGRCFTVDIDPEASTLVRELCSDSTEAATGDSVSFLADLSVSLGTRRIDLLYLDSFDLDPADARPSAFHHMKELTAVWRSLGPGTVVAVDDNPVLPDGHRIGKAMYVAQFFDDLGVVPFHTGYQLAWQL